LTGLFQYIRRLIIYPEWWTVWDGRGKLFLVNPGLNFARIIGVVLRWTAIGGIFVYRKKKVVILLFDF